MRRKAPFAGFFLSHARTRARVTKKIAWSAGGSEFPARRRAAVSDLALLSSRPQPPCRTCTAAPAAVDVRQPAIHGCGRNDLLRAELPCHVSAPRRGRRQGPSGGG